MNKNHISVPLFDICNYIALHRVCKNWNIKWLINSKEINNDSDSFGILINRVRDFSQLSLIDLMVKEKEAVIIF